MSYAFSFLLIWGLSLLLQDNIVSTALDDGSGGYHGDLRFLLQLRDRDGSAAAHRGDDLTQRLVQVVLHLTSVRNVAVDALLELQGCASAHVIALPVLRAVGALAPILLHDSVADGQLLSWRLVETGEVTSHHEEVRTHGQSQHHVVIVHKTAVATDWHVDASLLEIFGPCLSHVH